MSVDGCFEEMLLHTNDGVGPHTKTTLHYIEELKKKHGIDYDSHASYRLGLNLVLQSLHDDELVQR
jgi:hypothetical protein